MSWHLYGQRSFLLQLHLPQERVGSRHLKEESKLNPCVNCRCKAAFYLPKDPASTVFRVSQSTICLQRHGVWCPPPQSRWLGQVPRQLVITPTSDFCFKTPACGHQIVFPEPALLIPDTISEREQPPPCTGLPLDLGRNLWQHKKNLVPNHYMIALKRKLKAKTQTMRSSSGYFMGSVESLNLLTVYVNG